MSYVLFNRTDNFKICAGPNDFDNMWEYYQKGSFRDYMTIYERVIIAKMKDPKNLLNVPLRVFVKNSKYKTVRSYSKHTTLGALIPTIFPDMLSGSELKHEYQNIDVSICGLKQSAEVTLEYLYDIFKNPDGQLYLVVSI